MSAITAIGKNKALRQTLQKAIVNASKKLGMKALEPRMVDLIADSFVASLELLKDAGAGKLKNPKSLMPYLVAKGIIFANLSGKQQAECGAAIAGLITTIIASPALVGFGPAGWVALVGFTIIDLIEVGNKCEFIYEHYHIDKAVQKQQLLSSVELQPFPSLADFQNLDSYFSTEFAPVCQ